VPAEIVVYGATAGGVLAAVSAARGGARVTLIEPGRHLGGMVSGGLGWTDTSEIGLIGGMTLDFYEEVARRYDVEAWGIIGPEPHLAEAVFGDWLREAGVEVVFDGRLDRVVAEGRSIRRVVLEDGRAFEARVFIDAGYEGDLLARAGISYAVGRESVGLYGESWAGRQPIRPDRHQFLAPVSPFDSDNDSAVLPLIHDRPMVAEGEGDGGVQSYCFRLCLTDRPENLVPFAKPDGYDPQRYELPRRYLIAAEAVIKPADIMSLHGGLPNGKLDVNSVGAISTNLPDGSSWEYPEASYERRRAIWNDHLRYTQGLLYFLAHDPGVPAPIQTEFKRWGLCADEFADTGHWPHQLYVREARRMRGEYVMTQADLETGREHYDSVGMGSYNIDIREVQRVRTWIPRFPHLEAETYNEGYLSVPITPYQVPYRALLPRYAECDNLIVPVCLSASHVAFASLRMEPQYMILGHAAGVAAALAARDRVAVQHVGVRELQQTLAGQRQVLARSAAITPA
jgi:hypothetical protein